MALARVAGPVAALSPEDRLRIVEAVERISLEIAAPRELPALAHKVCAHVQEALGAEGASVFLREGRLLRVVGATGDAARSLIGTEIAVGVGVSGKVAASGASVLVDDAEVDPWVERGLSMQLELRTGFHLRTLVAAPLRLGGEVIGVVEAVNRAGSDRPFAQVDLAFLDALAPHVAAAVGNARLAAELRRSAAELAAHAAALEARVDERTALLSRGKREWELTFDSFDDPLAVIEDHRVVRANVAAARSSGRHVRDAIGVPCHQALFGRLDVCPGCPIAAARAADAHSASAELRADDRAVIARASRLDDAARPDAWVVHYLDVTEQRGLESRLKDAEHLSAVGRLAAGAAQEINNPLAFVLAAVRSLRQQVEDVLTAPGSAPQVLADAPQILTEAEVGARRIEGVVRALLALGRERHVTGERTPVIGSVRRASERALSTVPGGISPLVKGDGEAAALGNPLELDQAFFEIIRNALQSGGPVRVEVTQRADSVVVDIDDGGPGIPRELRTRVLEPFFSTRGPGRGLGLGLSLAYGVVRGHGGDLRVLDSPLGGARVRVELPSAPAPGRLDSSPAW